MPDPTQAGGRAALAAQHARAWMEAYGIRTEPYTRSGGDHPMMDTLPEAMLAFADALRDREAGGGGAGTEGRNPVGSGPLPAAESQSVLAPAGVATPRARPLDEWHEDMGNVLWWCFPVEEPPYCGSPHDLGRTCEITLRLVGEEHIHHVNIGGWPGYHTHFTPIGPPPDEPPARVSGEHPAGEDARRGAEGEACRHNGEAGTAKPRLREATFRSQGEEWTTMVLEAGTLIPDPDPTTRHGPAAGEGVGMRNELTEAQAALLRDMGDEANALRNYDEARPMWWIEGGRAVRGNVAGAVIGKGYVSLTGKWGGQPGILGFTRTEAGRRALDARTGTGGEDV